MIEIDETDSIEMNDGDPGYRVQGHVDLEEFLAAVKTYEVGECLIAAGDDPGYGAAHRWEVDREGKPGMYNWLKEPAPGARPVTICYPGIAS